MKNPDFFPNFFKWLLATKPRESKYEYPDPADTVFTTDLTDRDIEPHIMKAVGGDNYILPPMDKIPKPFSPKTGTGEFAFWTIQPRYITTEDSRKQNIQAEMQDLDVLIQDYGDNRKQNSREANEAKDKTTDYKRIIQSLSAIKQGTYYDIAIHSGLEPVAVGRRMKYLVDMGACNLLAIRMAAPGGRMCSVYRIKD